MHRIKIVNKIAAEGLDLFNDNYAVNEHESDPQAIVVRSSEIDTSAYPSLLAVARAGAGVNNITVAKATEQGICVLNTPGANANAVAELVFIMLGISARNIHQGMDFCQTLAGLAEPAVKEKIEAQKKKKCCEYLDSEKQICKHPNGNERGISNIQLCSLENVLTCDLLYPEPEEAF